MDTTTEKQKDLSEKVGEDIVDKIIDFYEIDIEGMEKKQKIIVTDLRNRLIKAAQKRRLEVEEKDGTLTITQHLRNGKDKFNYREIDGKSKLTFAGKEESDHHGKIYALLGNLSGEGESTICQLKGADMSTAECIGTLLLQV